MNAHKNLSSAALRFGLAFVFLYAAVGSLFNPQNWVGYFPHFLFSFLAPQVLLLGFSAAQIILAIWLLSKWRLREAALISAAMLAGIIVFNLNLLDVTFRDVGLFFAAAALFYSVSEKPE